jgi:hypothetical protein
MDLRTCTKWKNGLSPTLLSALSFSTLSYQIRAIPSLKYYRVKQGARILVEIQEYRNFMLLVAAHTPVS